MKADPKITAGRAFVRSLNILLKLARLYGYDHVRTNEQLDIAWRELRTAIPQGAEAGLLLGATGSQLLLDGVPLEGAHAEKQFAQLLSAAGLASVEFFPSMTEEEFRRFVRAFPTSKSKPAELAQQLKTSLSGARGIHINEVCFVATDSRFRETSVAAQLAAASLGTDHQKLNQWLNDPQKLLELIAAAQGSKGGGNATSGDLGTGSATSGYSGGGAGQAESANPVSGPAAGNSGGIFGAGLDIHSAVGTNRSAAGTKNNGPVGEPSEEDLYRILHALTSFGQIDASQNPAAGAIAFQTQVTELPERAQVTLKEAIAGLAAQAPKANLDESVLVKLAEHLAIRFALESFERGEVKVNAVRQLLDRLNSEIENLRKILGAHEDKMSSAGMLVESHLEILDRQFWAAVPESGKQAVLLSGEAWCVPPRNVQSYVSGLIEQGDVAEAISILQNYAACAESEEVDARKKTAVGLAELAELYAKAGPKLLGKALQHLGLRLSIENDSGTQSMVSAAFVRLSQEAATTRCYPAMHKALDLIAGVETYRPAVARTLRTKMGIEERVPQFVEEALRARQVDAELTSVLRLLPQTAMEHLATRLNRCSQRGDADHVASLAADLGEDATQYLRSTLRNGPVAEAVEMAGLLTRLDPESVEIFLPMRMKDFTRSAQDRMVRQISGSSAPARCRILLEILNHVDPLIMPLVIDEIGMASNRYALSRLLTIADGDLPAGAGPYLRVKAIEALGRIQAPESVSMLKRLLEAKKMFGWVHPQELRIAAIQALDKLDPDWVSQFLPKCGIEDEDLALAPLAIPLDSKFVRQRRHTRVRLRKPISAVSTNLTENCRLEIKTASLAGGVASISRHLAPGTQVQLRMQCGMRNLQATALMRDYRAQDMAFEIVDMSLDERSKYRRLLSGSAAPGARFAETATSAAPAEPVVLR